MSLVAYESSDESEEEITQKNNLSKACETNVKKGKASVKIIIPSLKEFQEENEVPIKKKKLQSGTGLFSLLPPPKNVSSSIKSPFIPHVLSSEKKQTTSNISKPVSSENIPLVTISPEQDEKCEADQAKKCGDDKSENHNFDYFSLDNSSKCETNLHTLSNCTELERNFSLFSEPQQLETSNDTVIHSVDSAHSSLAHISCERHSESVYSQTYLASSATSFKETTPSSSIQDSLLNDKQFLKLKGRQPEAVQIIDVNADDQLSDRNEWLLKSLTEESTHMPSRKKHNMPTQVQKRKHQITYLAYQAKEREMDLKKQWALNSRTRRETQAKYGF